MKKEIKVIWIDDLYTKEGEALMDRAFMNNIKIIPFEVHEKGIQHLKENEDIDAIILDARGYKNTDESTAEFSGLNYSIGELNELKNDRIIPTFILSGDKKLLNDKEFSGGLIGDLKLYIKAKDEDKLIEDLIKEVKNNPVTQMKHEYSDLFEMCENNYLDEGKKMKTRRDLLI